MSVSVAPVAAKSARPGIGAVVRWELTKLRYQKRTYLGLGAAALVPILFVVAIHFRHHRSGGGGDFAFASYLTKSGLVVPLVMLLFGAVWLFPLITALVSGDIFASEDHNGTLKTILTRSVDRHQVWLAKALAALTYALLALLLFAGVGLLLGGLRYGIHPLTSLSGTRIGVGHAFALMAAALGAYLLPVTAVVAIALLLSTVTRNSAAAIVGTLMISLLLQLIGIISGLEALKPYLLSTQFDAWQGLLREPVDWAPIARAAWVCALYALPCAAAGLAVFVRRDVSGG